MKRKVYLSLFQKEPIRGSFLLIFVLLLVYNFIMGYIMKNLKLIPPLKDNIWGGTKLKTVYGKNTDADIVAESWELSFHKDGTTMLEDGCSISDALTAEDLGVPLLILTDRVKSISSIMYKSLTRL